MKQTLLERRTKMLNHLCKGVPLKDIITEIAKDYHVGAKAIYHDWETREKWASQIAQLNDPTILAELLQGLKQILQNAWFEYATNPNPSAKIGALKLAKETYFDLIRILQSLGKLPTEPLKIEGGNAPFVIKMWKPEEDAGSKPT